MQLPVLKNNAIGMVIYDGPSNFTREDIVVIVTGLKRTKNKKTGKMLQAWILNKHESPMESLETGNDENVCGSCKMRHFRSCYVNIGQAPSQVWKAWKSGTYPMATPKMLALFEDKLIRLGAYGDPSAVPVSIWDSICGVAKGWTAYTHAWKRPGAHGHRKYCMASCDTYEETQDAISRGWKPFYVREEHEAVPCGFFVCPASEEAGKRLNCTECLACSGGEHRANQGVPTITAHGPSWKQAYYRRGIKAYKQKKAYRNINVAA